MGDNILQRITVKLEGGQQVDDALNKINNEFKKLQDTASSVKGGEGVADIGKQAKTAGENVDVAAGKMRNMRDVMDVLGATSKEAGKNIKGMSGSAASAVQGLKGLGDASDQAGAAVGATDVAAIRLGQSIRLIGRAARIPELSQLGRTVGVLGRAFEIAAPALFLAFLEKMASSAANAADKVADLAAKNKVSLKDFQDFGGAFTAIGAGTEEAGKNFESLTNVIKETASNTEKNEKNFKRMGEEIDTARNKAADLADGFVKIERESFRAFRDIRQEQDALTRSTISDERDFIAGLAKIQQARADITGGGPSAAEQKRRQLADLDVQEQKLIEGAADKARKRSEEAVKLREKEADAIRKQQEETKKLIEQEVEQDKKIRETQKALAEARIEADRNATALEKLGVRAVDGAGKLKKVPAVMNDIADALSRVTDAQKRETIENDLVAAGLDRKLIPALRRGAAGFKALEDEGKRIAPPFTTQEVATADAFQIAIGKAGSAIGALKNILGLAIAPAFTAFFERITEIFVGLQPAFREFGTALNGIVKPALEGLATVIKLVIDGFGTLFGLIASGINRVFGTAIGPATVFAGVLLALAVAFGGLPIAIAAAAAAIGKLIDAIDKADFSPIVKNATKSALLMVAAFALIVGPLLKIFSLVGTAIIPITRVFGAAIPVVTAFGSALTGVVGILIRAAVAVVGFIATFVSLPIIIAAVIGAAVGFFAVWAFNNWDKIRQFASDTWDKISAGAQALWDATKAIFSDGVAAVSQLVSDGLSAIAAFFTDTIPAAAKAGWDIVSKGASDLWTSITGAFQSGVDKVIGFLQRVKDFALSVWSAISGAAKQAASDQSAAADATGGGGFARGGQVWGRGTSTSDSIPAWLSTGEFVHQAKAVRFYGADFMRAINAMRLPKEMVRGFNLGGLADRLALNLPGVPMGFAEGGPVTGSKGLHPVTIDLGGGKQVSGLQASSDVVKNLTRASISRQSASAGRKPSYYGRGK